MTLERLEKIPEAIWQEMIQAIAEDLRIAIEENTADHLMENPVIKEFGYTFSENTQHSIDYVLKAALWKSEGE